MTRFFPAWALALGGCLITNPAEIGDHVNSPPSIRSPESAEADDVAMNQIITADYTEGGQLAIPIIVRDENLDDELVTQVWVDFQRGTGGAFTGQRLFGDDDPERVIRASGSPDRDEKTIVIDHSILADVSRCHRIEVFVTKQFDSSVDDPNRQPNEPGDLGTATFWVAMYGTSGDPVDMSSCP